MGTMSLMTAESAIANCAITTDMLKPLLDGISANVAVIIPIGIGIMGIMYGPKLIPKIAKLFSK